MKNTKIRRVLTILGLLIRIIPNNHAIKAMELEQSIFIEESTQSGSDSSQYSPSDPGSSRTSSNFSTPAGSARSSISEDKRLEDKKVIVSQEDKTAKELEQKWEILWQEEQEDWDNKLLELPPLSADSPAHEQAWVRIHHERRHKNRKALEKNFYDNELRDACRTEDAQFQNACRNGDVDKINQFLDACDLTDITVDPEKLQTLEDVLTYFKTIYHRYNVRYAFVHNARKMVTLQTILENKNVIKASLVSNAKTAPLITKTDINAALLDTTGEYDQDSKEVVKYLKRFTFTPGETHYIEPRVMKVADEYLASFAERERLDRELQEKVKKEQKQEQRLKGHKIGKLEQTKSKKIAPQESSQNLKILPSDGKSKSSRKSSFWSLR